MIGSCDKTDTHSQDGISQVYINPIELPPEAVIRQFAAGSRRWQRAYDTLCLRLEPGQALLQRIVEHIGCDLMLRYEGLIVHVVLQCALESIVFGLIEPQEQAAQFLMAIETSLCRIPGFEVHSPGVSSWPWTLAHPSSFDDWRGDVPVNFLLLRGCSRLNMGCARRLLARVGADELYAYASRE
jgi:hypothetical protein